MENNNLPSLEEWIESEEGLTEILTELYESDLPIEDQARKALDYLCETYDLPQTPLDVQDEDWENDLYYFPISMFELVAQLRFADPENIDPRYLVLNAAYLIKHNFVIDLSQTLSNYLRDGELQGLGYRGEDTLVAELVPVKMGESWVELGCTYFTKGDVT